MSHESTAGLLRRAADRRDPLRRRVDLTAYRLVNGAADGLPGLAVDRLGDVLVLHADNATQADAAVAGARAALPEFRAAYVKIHPPQASRLREEPTRLAWGEPVDSVVVCENALRFLTRPSAGLATGLFLDMRDVRAWLGEVSAGRSVLNVFAYTCAFGVAAIHGQAERVLNLDLSQRYLAWGRDNYALNALDVDPRDFVYGDALDWLERFARRGQRFDLVIVDPPSFSSSARATFAAERDYPRLAAAAARVVASGGILLAATNHGGISRARFDALLARGVSDAARQARQLRSWHEPAIDFPIPMHGVPYLKVRALVLE